MIAKSMHVTSKVRRKKICHTFNTGHCDSEIYARNPISPAEKDLLYHKPALKIFFICSYMILKAVLGELGLGGGD